MIPKVIDNYILVHRVAVIYSLVPKVFDFINLVAEISDFDSLVVAEVSRRSRFIRKVSFWMLCLYLGEVRWQRIVWELWSCFQRWIMPYEKPRMEDILFCKNLYDPFKNKGDKSIAMKD